ncbi:MAG: metal ABC transporter ATP-binding protein [Chloroflexota bacterium]|nr:metal ABC transporter ATP-binding protein [Chloroflexota bacterium]
MTIAPAAAAVSLVDVSAGYNDRIALEGVNLDVPSGSLLAIVGPNGAGKSTLLKVIAGLLPVWGGSVSVLGAAPGGAARRIAYVPQAELVDWHFPITVSGVVMMGRYPGLGLGRRPTRHDQEAVRQALASVGMLEHAEHQIGALSGGQRRRVFLARAVAADADLFLLDEPVTGVDAATQQEIMDILATNAAMGRTIIATTHDLACAAECFQRVVAINRTVVADGPAKIALDPEMLARAYSGHLLVLEGNRFMLDDAHHHDESGAERHFHDGGG